MNRLLAMGLAVMLASTAYAGGNPGVRIYVDFDPPNYVHSVYPEPWTIVEAYICLDNLGIGFDSVSLGLTDLMTEHPGVFGTQAITYLLPGDLPL